MTQTLRVESLSKARLTHNAKSAPLYVRGDILSGGTIHTEKEIVLHDSKSQEDEYVYPGTIRFRDGDFYGYTGEDRGWVNWNNPLESHEKRFIELCERLDEKEIWKPFWNENTYGKPNGWAYYNGSIAIGKSYSNEGILEVGGDCVIDRKLTVKSVIKCDGGIRLTSSSPEQEGMLRYNNGTFEGFGKNGWVQLNGEIKEEKIIREIVESPTIDLSNYATKDYVDRLISIGMLWFPVIDYLILLPRYMVMELNIQRDMTQGVYKINPNKGEFVNNVISKLQKGMRIWFLTSQYPHDNIKMLQVSNIIPAQKEGDDWILEWKVLDEDPYEWKTIQLGSLSGILVKNCYNVENENYERRYHWWMRKSELDILEFGEFSLQSQEEKIKDENIIKVKEEINHDYFTKINDELMIQLNKRFQDFENKMNILTTFIEVKDDKQIKIPNGFIQREHIQSKCIHYEHIQNQSIKEHHLSNNIIDSHHLKENVFQADHLGNGVIEGRHLVHGCITSSLIAPGSINEVHLSDTLELKRILSPNSIETNWLKDNCVTSNKIAECAILSENIGKGVIRKNHLSEHFKLTGEHLMDQIIEQKHIKAHSISCEVLRPQSGTKDLFRPESLPGWLLIPGSVHGKHLIEESLRALHLVSGERGFKINWEGNYWSKENTQWAELGKEIKIKFDNNYGLWKRHSMREGRNWIDLYQISDDIELGEKSVFERLWWDETGYANKWEEIPERWSRINLQGYIQSRGVWYHRGTLKVKGKIENDEFNNLTKVVDNVYRHSLYDSCPKNTIIRWRRKNPIPKGWEEVEELNDDNTSFIWIEKVNIELN
jgi:hypothetical protein